ncbi:MAG: response regulator transcription factor [Bacteroidia bacterium]
MIYLSIVEDKQYLVNHLKTVLSEYEDITLTFCARNGVEFLEKSKSKKYEIPDIVLVDIDMPEMNGIELVKVASQIYPSMKFLIYTVFDDDDKIFEAIKAGASGYILKEEKIEKIVEAIRELKDFDGAPMSPRIARKTLQMLSGTIKLSDKETKEEPILSEREMEILKMMIEGLNYKEIADKIFLSPHTVRTHISNIYKKLHVSNKAQMMKMAMKKGWF